MNFLRRPLRLPSPALTVATGSVALALAGGAVALPGTGTVNSGDIADGQVRAVDLAPPKQERLILTNGWRRYTESRVNAPVATRDGFGYVHLEGAIDGDESTSDVAFVLEPGYFPRRPVYHPVDTANARHGRIFISPEGLVSFEGAEGSSSFVSLEGVVFRSP